MNNIELSFRKDLGHSYMVLKNPCPPSDYQFYIKMLKHNVISGLLTTSDEILNGDFSCLYDISSRQSLEKIYETEKMSHDVLAAFVNSLKALRSNLDDYLLDLKYVLIQPRFIFMDTERNNFYFCYFPSASINEEKSLSDIQNFFNQILSVIDYNDPEAVSLAFNISRLVQMDEFTLQELPSSLPASDTDNQAPFHIPPQENSSLLFLPSQNPDNNSETQSFWKKAKFYFSNKEFGEVIDDINDGIIIKKIRELNTPSPLDDQPASTTLSKKETSFQVYDLNVDDSFFKSEEPSVSKDAAIEDTAALNSDILSIPCLVGTGTQTGTRIQLDHFPFTIGKKAASNDYVINDSTISRCHCRFYKTGDEYFLEDLNSTNGSFVNDKKLDTYTRCLLNYGDLIKLASLEFYFH